MINIGVTVLHTVRTSTRRKRNVVDNFFSTALVQFGLISSQTSARDASRKNEEENLIAGMRKADYAV